MKKTRIQKGVHYSEKFDSSSHYNLVRNFISVENPGRESRCWQGVGKVRSIGNMTTEERQERKQNHSRDIKSLLIEFQIIFQDKESCGQEK